MSPPIAVPELQIVAWTPLRDDPDRAEECVIGPFRVVAAPPNIMRFGFWVVTLNGFILASQHIEVTSVDETKRLGLGQVQRFATLLAQGAAQLLPA